MSLTKLFRLAEAGESQGPLDMHRLKKKTFGRKVGSQIIPPGAEDVLAKSRYPWQDDDDDDDELQGFDLDNPFFKDDEDDEDEISAEIEDEDDEEEDDLGPDLEYDDPSPEDSDNGEDRDDSDEDDEIEPREPIAIRTPKFQEPEKPIPFARQSAKPSAALQGGKTAGSLNADRETLSALERALENVRTGDDDLQDWIDDLLSEIGRAIRNGSELVLPKFVAALDGDVED